MSPEHAPLVGEGFESVARLFASFLAEDPDYSAQFAVYHRGIPVLDLVGGPHTAPDSVTGVFSCSKGAAALTIGLLVQDGLLDLDELVCTYWPEFAANGKGLVTVRQLLSHQAGLVGVEGGMTLEEYNDSRLAAVLLAAAPPLWRPGSAHGYHALTMGVLLEELCRRLTGERLQDVFESRIRGPYGVDFYLGLPAGEEARFRSVLKPLQEPPVPWLDPRGIAGIALNGSTGFDGPDGPSTSIFDLPNVRAAREAGMSAAAGVGSARGLARLYAAASTGVDGGAPFLGADTVEAMSREQAWGLDRMSNLTGAFAIVFMKPQARNDFGSWRAYGHDGANGALSFADPAYETAFGYVPQRAELGGTGSRGGQLAVALRQAVLAL